MEADRAICDLSNTLNTLYDDLRTQQKDYEAKILMKDSEIKMLSDRLDALEQDPVNRNNYKLAIAFLRRAEETMIDDSWLADVREFLGNLTPDK